MKIVPKLSTVGCSGLRDIAIIKIFLCILLCIIHKTQTPLNIISRATSSTLENSNLFPCLLDDKWFWILGYVYENSRINYVSFAWNWLYTEDGAVKVPGIQCLFSCAKTQLCCEGHEMNLSHLITFWKLVTLVNSYAKCLRLRYQPGVPNVNFRKISVRKTWNLEFSEPLL